MIRINIDKPQPSDPAEPTAPDVARIIEKALKESGLRVTETHYVNAATASLMATCVHRDEIGGDLP